MIGECDVDMATIGATRLDYYDDMWKLESTATVVALVKVLTWLLVLRLELD